MKKNTRKAKDLDKVPHPPVRKDSLKDLNPGDGNVKGGGSVTCYCSRSR